MQAHHQGVSQGQASAVLRLVVQNHLQGSTAGVVSARFDNAGSGPEQQLAKLAVTV
jgi:hypothetical protein